ncbi:MAG: lytic murein transglycosylase [Candidatus Nomurabacteria bacterium]|nr:lytic murein transglycosylase [Candidatus Nomurabacteria bacterium]
MVRTYNVRADFDCLTLSTSSTVDQKRFCQNELDQLNQQLIELSNQLSNQKKTTGSFKSDIDSLTKQINALKVKIKARTLAIATLKVSISEKITKIETLSEKIDKEHQSLAQLLRNTNEFDNENILHLIISDNSISSFYSDLESYDSIKKAVKTSVDTINGIKTQTEIQKTDLQKQQDAQIDAKAQLEAAQKKVSQTQAEKKQLLAVSKQKESDYQTVISEREKRIADIKSRLFSLAGGSQAIRFDVALGYAEDVSRKTNIDPAFLLAIITQESKLGANVGQCYLKDSNTGAGVGKNTGTKFSKVMKPSRDVGPFMDITNSLGLNAFETAVSCPIPSAGGWGGAMGPAQFIPSTWKLFISRISKVTNSNPPSPWDPEDAFTASALYLTDLGAVGDSTSAQSRAACKYYGSGGASCSYSKSVIALKNKIQGDIDYLKQYGVAKN